jgi:4-hydroxy-tetrahydrodipicolinate synthase
MARDLGAHGAMVITPYYNKPTQKGLLEHFTKIAESTDLNLLLYNVPGRTGINMLPSTAIELAEHPRIAALKEASGNLEQISEICAATDGRMNVLSGDDALTLPVMAVGGKGVVSVSGQVLPKPLVTMVKHVLAGEFDKALPLHHALLPLHKAMFIETNPAPAKTALVIQGKIKNEFRLPMVPVSETNKQKIKEVIVQVEQATAELP